MCINVLVYFWYVYLSVLLAFHYFYTSFEVTKCKKIINCDRYISFKIVCHRIHFDFYFLKFISKRKNKINKMEIVTILMFLSQQCLSCNWSPYSFDFCHFLIKKLTRFLCINFHSFCIIK